MILAIRTEIDSVLSVVAPLGLAAAAERPALLIDLDPEGPSYPGPRSLADLAEEGPTRAELEPSGIAVLRNGGITYEDSQLLVARLVSVWPSVTLRLGSGDDPDVPLVPVVPLLPGVLAPLGGRAAVWQRTSAGQVAPGPGPVLPLLSRARLTTLLEARTLPRGRWVAAWKAVWRLPWG